MLEFLILVCITGSLLGLAVMRLAKSRFPSGADLALVSTFYYSVPLAILAFLSIDLRQATFLNEIAANGELALISLRYVCLAMVCVELGRFAGRRMGDPRFSFVFDINEAAPYRAALLAGAVLLLFPVGVAIFGVEDFLQGYAAQSMSAEGDTGNALIYWAVEALGITMAFLMIMRLVFGRMPMKPVFFLSLACIAVIFVIRVKRLEVIAALLPVAIILFANRSHLSAKFVRAALGVALLLVLAVVSASRMSEALDAETLLFYFLSEGLYAGHSLPGIVHRLSISVAEYEYGWRFVNSFLAFIPSVIWSAKAEVLYEPDFIFQGISPLGATTLLTEIVLQGGAVAVAVFYSLLGLFFERVGRFQDTWDESLETGRFPARFGLYLITVSLFIPHFRDGVIPALKVTYQGLVYFVVLAAVHRVSTWRVPEFAAQHRPA